MSSKHVIFTIGVAFVASAFLCGCSSADERLAPVSEVSEISEDSPSETAGDDYAADRLAPQDSDLYEEDSDDDGANEWTSLDEDSIPEDTSDMFSFATDDKSQIVIVDGNGNVKRVLDPQKEAGIDINEGDYVDVVSGNYFMFHKSVREDGNYKSEIYLYDMNEDTISYVDTVDYFNAAVIIDGDLYIEYSNYDSAAGASVRVSVKYKNNYDGTFDRSEVYSELNELCKDEKLTPAAQYTGDKTELLIPYCLDKYGKIPVKTEAGLAVYDEDCNCCGSMTTEKTFSAKICGFDGKNVIYELKDRLYNTEGVYCFDSESETSDYVDFSQFPYFDGEPTVLCYEDGIVYIGVVDEDGGQSETDVYSYDVRKKKTEFVMCEEAVPGHYYLPKPILYGFKAFGDKLYYLAEGDGTTEWYTATKNGDEWESTPLEVVACEYSYAEYGKVRSFKIEARCPYCGTKCFEDYYEWIDIDPSVKNADKINAVIQEKMAEEKEAADNYEASFNEDDCKNFLHSGEGYGGIDTESLYIRDMREIFGRYLFIERNGYSYLAGGAHGYPKSENLLFDLNTGKEVWLEDLFNIPEEVLKENVANNARKQFDGNLDELVYAESADELYGQVYEEVSYDFPFITFYDTYLTFDFQPYDLGTYAAGTVSVKVPYSDLR